MVKKIQLLRNIGTFDNVAGGAQFSFTRLVLIYAENGRGKTTLAAILRSLATGDPLPLSERQRLSSLNAPHAIIDCTGGPTPAIFRDGQWDRVLGNVAIFDDVFVDENLHSGLSVSPTHRKNLHGVVLGAQGVVLQRVLDEFVNKVEQHNAELRIREAAIPSAVMGSLKVDDFCALPSRVDVDSALQEVERKIAAVREHEPVRTGEEFAEFSLPRFDLESFASLLQTSLSTLDVAAAARVNSHLETLGGTAGTWVREGLSYLSNSQVTLQGTSCPFCLQDLSASTIIEHYRAYFSDQYAQLTRSIATAVATVKRQHGGDALAGFERSVRVAVELRQFWAKFCDVPEVALDTGAVARVWKAAREGILSLLERKQAAPLEPAEISPGLREEIRVYHELSAQVSDTSKSLQLANGSIRLVKEQAAAGNTAALESDRVRLKSTKDRYSPAIATLCAAYSEEKKQKASTTAQRDQARAALESYHKEVFPAYSQAVNDYLQRFNAGFRIEDISTAASRAGVACNYNLVIDSKPIAVSGGEPKFGAPSFRNTLSAGDRNTLALAFFFASLERDPDLSTKTLVIDDPISSLDEHRSWATVQQIRQIAQRVAQVIVLAHDKRLLARIWDQPGRDKTVTALQILRDGQGSTFAPWNVQDDGLTEYERRHALLRGFLSSGKSDAREVAQAIRPVLEVFMRVSQPERFPPGHLLGKFLGECEQRVGKSDEILSREAITMLKDILEYANKFHHDTNPAWETETINDGELRAFVNRSLVFIGRK